MSEQKYSFILPHLGKLQNLAKWPNADVATMALVTELIPKLCGVPYDLIYRDDPTAMAECSLLVHEFLGVDIMVGNLDAYNFEAEAMGAKMRFYEDRCPDIDRSNYFINGWEDLDKIRFRGLDTGRLPYLIDYTMKYIEYTGIPSFPAFSAPWTLASNLYGLDNLVFATIEDPEFVHELLNRIVDDFHIPMFAALKEKLPYMSQMFVADAFASIPMVTIDIIEEFIKPSVERLVAGVCTKGEPFVNTAFFGHSKLKNKEDLKRFEDFVVYCNSAFFCTDPDVAILTPEYARKRADDYLVPLQSGVGAPVIEFGTKEEIVEKVKHYTLAGKRGLTPMTFFFNNIPANSPVENIQVAIQTVSIYGAPGADENTPYVDPDFITFENFLRHKMADNPEGYKFEWLKKSRLAFLAE